MDNSLVHEGVMLTPGLPLILGLRLCPPNHDSSCCFEDRTAEKDTRRRKSQRQEAVGETLWRQSGMRNTEASGHSLRTVHLSCDYCNLALLNSQQFAVNGNATQRDEQITCVLASPASSAYTCLDNGNHATCPFALQYHVQFVYNVCRSLKTGSERDWDIFK